MRRALIAVGAGALVIAGLGLSATAEAAPPPPTHVRTTLQLLPDATHRVVSTGHAPAGARVVLQNRFSKHDRYATAASTRASGSGSFRISKVLKGEAHGRYRTCVLRGPRDFTCTRGAKPLVLLRKGKISDFTAPDQIVEGEISQFTANLSHWVQGVPWKIQYQDSAGAWKTFGSSSQISGGSPAHISYPIIGPPPGMPAGQSVAFRIVTENTHDVARAVSETVRRPVYRARLLSTLTPVSGSLTVRGDGATVTPAGTSPTQSATLALPQNCGRLVFAFREDSDVWEVDDLFTGSVSVNGATVYDHPASSTQDYAKSVTLPPNPTQLTLTASYDALEPTHRPWFAQSGNSSFIYPPGPYVLCAS